jgi:[ribosomal protein S5]-alanine N-acetyltransferase
MRTVETTALTLEPLSVRHAAEMFAVLADPAIYEYENEPPASLDALRRRYAALESRRSPDGREVWLNWVIRLPSGAAIGYVQATVFPDRRAAIAYELGSAWWGRGLARRAVEAMLAELVSQHGVLRLTAVLKQRNQRSLRLLERLGFAPAPADDALRRQLDDDETLMTRQAAPADASSAPTASDRLRGLARRVAQAHVGIDPPVVLSLVSGSTVEDIADAWSDVDMSVIFEILPNEDALRAACAAAGGLPWFWQTGSLAEGSLVVAFRLDGIEVQIGYSDLATLHRELDQVLVDHDPDTPQHKLAEGMAKAEPLIGEARLRALQARIAVFPPELGRAMAAHFMGRVTPWRALSQLLHRDATLWCRELQVAACYKLLGALAGLNGVYFTTFQFKRMTRFAAKLKLAPTDFSMRIERLLQGDSAAALVELHALEGEVVELLAARWPDLDLAAVRERRLAFVPPAAH